MAFQYKKRTLEDIKRKESTAGKDFDPWLNPTIPTFKPKAGSNRVRILPPTWDSTDFEFVTWAHYGVGPDEQTYICPAKMGKGKCPICEERARNRGSLSKEENRALSPRQRPLVYVIDRTDEDAGPKIWPIPITVSKELVLRQRDVDGSIIYIDHPEEGYDIEFVREGEGIGTKYLAINVARKATPLSIDEDQMNEWLNFIVQNPLPDQVIIYDYERIANAFGNFTVPKKDTEIETKVDEVKIEESFEDEDDLDVADYIARLKKAKAE